MGERERERRARKRGFLSDNMWLMYRKKKSKRKSLELLKNCETKLRVFSNREGKSGKGRVKSQEPEEANICFAT